MTHFFHWFLPTLVLRHKAFNDSTMKRDSLLFVSRAPCTMTTEFVWFIPEQLEEVFGRCKPNGRE